MTRRFTFVWLAVFVTMGPATAGPAEDHFENKIRPILVDRCFKCHSEAAKKSQGGLKLDSRAAILTGGDTGPAAVVGQPKTSLIVQAIQRTSADVSAMPPTGTALTPAEVQAFEQWINDGLVYPAAAKPTQAVGQHFAFTPVKPPKVPNVTATDWPRTDVDRFILHKLETAKLTPAADAGPEVIARRLSFALIGLPPTPSDLAAVRTGTLSLPKYVDQLLASPHFGERWARHWMDVVRYADSAGTEYDYEIEGAWRYRDYLVRAFNADIPFDVFGREHVAGDCLPSRVVDGRNEALLATGWWNLQEMACAPVDVVVDEAERLDNQLDTLGKAFQGLTVGCARCHDHKFDLIRTKEYYGLFGIAAASPAARVWANAPAFDGPAATLKTLRDQVDRLQPQPEPIPLQRVDTSRATVVGDFATGVPADWWTFGHVETITPETAGLRGVPPGVWSGTVSRKLPAMLRSPQFVLDTDFIDVYTAGEDATVQVVVANYQQIRDPIYHDLKKRIKTSNVEPIRFHVGRWKGKRAHVEVFTGTVDGSYRILHTNDSLNARFGLRAVLRTNSGAPAKLSIATVPFIGRPTGAVGALLKQFAEVESRLPIPERFLGVSDHQGTDVPVYARGDANKPKPGREPRVYISACGGSARPTTGSGRRELADALFAPTNPLTARVFVNRVWHHLFGRGLVATVDNFGTLGDAPTHPELLDYLAHRFVTVHRWSLKALLRELVATRTYGLQTGPAPTADAENRLLSRFPLRRLDAEAVRDAVLVAAGTLDPSFGGEPIPVPHRLAGSGSDSGNNYPPSGPVDGQNRRSLYLASRRNFPNTFLEVFDKPPTLSAFGRRDVTNVPTQALTLLNDPFMLEQADRWATRTAGDKNPETRLQQLFEAALGRRLTTEERSALLATVDRVGWPGVALIMFNTKEFLYVP